MAERVDLYTYDRRPTGETALRGEKLPPDRYRMVVHVCLFGSDGRMLIQQRSASHARWTGLWDVTMGGGAQMGDDSRSAAARELLEEIGLRADFTGLPPALTLRPGQVIDDFYILRGDPAPENLRLQAEEVQAVRWADAGDIHRMIDAGTFIPYRHELIDLLFALRDSRGCWTRPDRRGTAG